VSGGGRAVRVRGVPAWVDHERLLGPGPWSPVDEALTAELPLPAAADLAARLRGVGLDGRQLEVEVTPELPRAAVRAARAEDARRRRDPTPGFERPGARLDDEGRWSLTPEALALALGRRAAGRQIFDAGCACGGNTIGFARAGCRVIAVERDATRLALARHNVRLYGVADRVRLVHADALEALEAAPDALVFVDPPWGVDWSRTRTTVDDLPLLRALLDTGRALWAKVPPSFDTSTAPGARATAWFGERSGDRQRVKFVLLELEARS
jgi:predicted RNA methylase